MKNITVLGFALLFYSAACGVGLDEDFDSVTGELSVPGVLSGNSGTLYTEDSNCAGLNGGPAFDVADREILVQWTDFIGISAGGVMVYYKQRYDGSSSPTHPRNRIHPIPNIGAPDPGETVDELIEGLHAGTEYEFWFAHNCGGYKRSSLQGPYYAATTGSRSNLTCPTPQPYVPSPPGYIGWTARSDTTIYIAADRNKRFDAYDRYAGFIDTFYDTSNKDVEFRYRLNGGAWITAQVDEVTQQVSSGTVQYLPPSDYFSSHTSGRLIVHDIPVDAVVEWQARNLCASSAGFNNSAWSAIQTLECEDDCGSAGVPSGGSMVPILSSNTSNGSVTRSGVYSGAYEAWHAFDGTGAMWISPLYENSAWIGYEWADGEPRTVADYTIVFTNGSLWQRAPKDFQLQGSNDGASWMTVSSIINQVNWGINGGPTTRNFMVANPTPFKRYRLLVTRDNYDDPTWPVTAVSLGKLILNSPSLVPDLSSNDSNGSVTYSSRYSTSYDAYKAFDRSTSMWLSAVYENNAWIAYQFPGGGSASVTNYSILFTNGSLWQRAPKDFQLQGSNNGSSWSTLHSTTNQTDWGVNSGLTIRNFTVGSPGSYKHYRLLITKDNYDNATWPVTAVSVGELRLYGQ